MHDALQKLLRAASSFRSDVETYKGVRIYGHGGGISGYALYMFFLPDHDTGVVLLTNWHVISQDGVFPRSIRPGNAVANFEASGQRYRVDGIVSSSPALDAGRLVRLAARARR